MTEVLRVLNNATDNVYSDLFIRSSHDVSLNYQPDLIVPFVISVLNRKNSLRYFGSIIWNSLPVQIRKPGTLSVFELKIKEWKPNNCKCRLRNENLGSVGFI